MTFPLPLFAALSTLLGGQKPSPASDPTLSLFEPREGQCQWSRMDPVTQKRTGVAAFEGECKGARLSWSKDGSQALVWFDPQWVQPSRSPLFDEVPVGYPREEPTPGATPRLYEVTLASGQVRALPFPPVRGELKELGYNAGRITALSIQYLSEEEQAKDSLTVEGKRIDLRAGGKKVPSLAYAYQLTGTGPWKNVAAKAAPRVYDRDYSFSVLGDLASLGPSAEETLSPRAGDGDSLTEEQEARMVPLLPAPLAQKAQQGEPPRGQWFHGTTPAGSFYVWSVSGHGVYTTGHLVLEVGGKPRTVKEPGFTVSEFVSWHTQGPFILGSGPQAGTHPRLYDARTGQLVFQSDTARLTTFWPGAEASK